MMMKMMRVLMFKRSTGSLHTHNYCIPPITIMEVVNSPRGLNRIPSPSKDKVVLLRKSILPPIFELARRKDRLAGLRIDAETNMRSREPWYTIEGIKNSQSEGPIQKIRGITSSLLFMVVHPRKIAICGHSFGALMTSILLVHVPHLFCGGVARSGAYNRTLTPFGYQVSGGAQDTMGGHFVVYRDEHLSFCG